MYNNIKKHKTQLKIVVSSKDKSIAEALVALVVASGNSPILVKNYEKLSDELYKLHADLVLIDTFDKHSKQQKDLVKIINSLVTKIPIILAVNSNDDLKTNSNVYFLKKPISVVDFKEAIKTFAYMKQKIDAIRPIKIANLQYYEDKRIFMHRGKEISLTSLENKIFKILLDNLNKTVTRKILLNKVWGYSSDVNSQTIETHIWRLRKKLGVNENSSSILKTVKGGYCLNKN